MSTVHNTAYRVKVDDDTDAELAGSAVEDGALVRTDSGLYMGHNGQNVVVYPQDVTTIGGWARYDDSQYTSSNKLTLTADTEVVVPNNANNVVRSHASIAFYNSTTKKILGINENDVYVFTWAFKASATNANQTFLEYNLEGSGQISRVAGTLTFPRGNDEEHIESIVMQYYTDSTFVSDGVQLKITSIGGASKLWDSIYFIQRTQNADFS